MGELCLGHPSGLVFCPQQSICRASKDYQPFLSSLRSREDMVKLCSLYIQPCHIEEPWKPVGGLSEGTQFVKTDPAIRTHVLNGARANIHPSFIFFSFGIARQIIRHEKILKFLRSGSSVREGGGFDISILSNLIGLQELTIDMPQQPFILEHGLCSCDAESQPSLVYPSSDFCFWKPMLDIPTNMAHESKFVCQPDEHLSCIGAGTEMKDILPIIDEFYSPKSLTKWDKKSLLVPYFNRRKRSAAKAGGYESSLKLETVKVAPLKRPEKTKGKQSLKKKSNKATDRERYMYTKSYVHACESLLSIMIDKKRQGKAAVLSVKKSGLELPQLLTQISASIAGTGLAVLFCVISKVACSKAPFYASKILSAGLGLGLVWLSGAVNRLRDTLMYINKMSSKLDHEEEDMMKILDRSVNEIYFRSATLLAVVVLRLA